MTSSTGSDYLTIDTNTPLAVTITADFEYKCTDYYNPADEDCLIWNDPDVGIDWPIEDPVLSEKDQQGSLLKDLMLEGKSV